MKRIILFLSVITISISALAEGLPKIEIIEYGIYTRTERRSVADPSAPTGQKFIGGKALLEKQTDVIPAELGGKFGFAFSIQGEHEKPIPLTVVYHFPKMTDPKTKKEFALHHSNIHTIPSEPMAHMLWDFTESWELVPGEWIFQIYQGKNKLVEKKFTVVKE